MVTDGFFIILITCPRFTGQNKQHGVLAQNIIRRRSAFEIHTRYCGVTDCGYGIFHRPAATRF